jgi:PEP-CTERM motif
MIRLILTTGIAFLAITPAMADRGTASVGPPSLASFNAAGTPNAPFSDKFTLFPASNNIVSGSDQLENGDSISSAQVNAGFGRSVTNTAATAFVQAAGTPPGDIRFGFIDPNKSQPFAFSRIFTYDFIRLNTSVSGPLFATFRVNVTGSLNATANAGNAQLFGNFSVTGTFADTNSFNIFSVGDSLSANGSIGESVTRVLDGNYIGILPFTGSNIYNPFQFRLDCFTVLSNIGSANSGNASCNNLGYTWGGIESVRDARGNLVTDWSISSSSGFNYANAFSDFITAPPIEVDFTPFPFPGSGAVPEPQTWLMMIIGFGMIGGTLRCQSVKRLAKA